MVMVTSAADLTFMYNITTYWSAKFLDDLVDYSG